MKILVTGLGGLVGHALFMYNYGKACTPAGNVDLKPPYNFSFSPPVHNHKFIFTDRSYDLRDKKTVDSLLEFHKPDAIIHTAANVGGLMANIEFPVNCFTDNIRMNTNIIESAVEHDIKNLIAFSSVCAYPDHLTLLHEDKMHDGPPHAAHFGYAHAKRMVDVLVQSCRKQYGSNFCTITPVNMYGPNDYYNLHTGHVMPSLTLKCFNAVKNDTTFEVWGDGTPKREFIYTEDVAQLVVNLLERGPLPDRLIISNGVEVSIREIAEIIAEIFGYNKEIKFNTSAPNGQLRRSSDPTRLNTIFPNLAWTPLKEGMTKTLNWFKLNYPNVRQ